MTTCAAGHALIEYRFAGPWFKSDEAAAYLGIRHRCGCPSVKSFWNWRQRYGVVMSRRLVAKADLDRVIRQQSTLRPSPLQRTVRAEGCA